MKILCIIRFIIILAGIANGVPKDSGRKKSIPLTTTACFTAFMFS